MKTRARFLAFMIGLALVLSAAAALKRLGITPQNGVLIQAQAAGASAPGYSLDWNTIDGGGGSSSGGGFQVSGSIGQPDAGSSAGGGFTLLGGFWPGALQPFAFFMPVIQK